MTDRQMFAYILLALLAAAVGALIWRWRYQSQPQVYARQQERRRKQDETRALAEKAAEGDGKS